MGWQTTADVDDFLDAAGGFLRSRPVENTVLLTVTGSLRDCADPLFGWCPAGAFLHTPPFPVLLSALPGGAAADLAGLLADRPQSGVNGLVDDADAYAAVWRERTGGRSDLKRRTRLFRLGELTPPERMPPGRARVATTADRDLLLDWFTAFHLVIGEERDDYAGLVDDKLAYGGMWLWDLAGESVAMAGLTRPEAGMVRVVSVFTPTHLRGRGFGAAVTAAVTRAALDGGARDVVLHTDLANPISNALYPRLGYRPVEDRRVLEFSR